MSASFTPGEWRIWRDMDKKQPVEICGMEGDFICQIHGENTNATANATLITAAPELLAALEALLAVTEEPALDELPNRQATAREAIAKAIGGGL